MKKTLYFDASTDKLVKKLAKKLTNKKRDVSESQVVRLALTALSFERMVDALDIQLEK